MWNPVKPRQLLAFEICILHQKQNRKIVDVAIKDDFHYIYSFRCNIAISYFFYGFFDDKPNFMTCQCQQNNGEGSTNKCIFLRSTVAFADWRCFISFLIFKC